MKLNKFYF